MKIVTLTQIFVCLFFVTSMKALSQDYSFITQEVDSIITGGTPGPIFAYKSNVVPIVASKQSVLSVASLFGNGKVMAIGHPGILDDKVIEKYDNLRFLINSMKWLSSSNKKILMKNGTTKLSSMNILKNNLESEGFTITAINTSITETDLENIDIILFGNDWNNNLPYSESQINIIRNFVENGGGVFIAGLGWSFKEDLSIYPMNNISQIFGFKFIRGYIKDPDNNEDGSPYFLSFYPSLDNLTVLDAIRTLKQVTLEHSSSLPAVLQNDNIIRESFTDANMFLTSAIDNLPAVNELRDSIYDAYSWLILNFPDLFQKIKSYNTNSETAFIWNRERMYLNLRNVNELVNAKINEIGQTMGLTGIYNEIWEKYNILLIDNLSLDASQLKFTLDILNSIPKELHNLGFVSFNSLLGSTYNLDLTGGNIGGINTFSTKTTYLANHFPKDISPIYNSNFCIAMAHEMNHRIEPDYLTNQDTLLNRKTQLIQQAGQDSLQYLRSMFAGDFFTERPQEFIASIANEWFSDSKHTFDLGLQRFNNDHHEPINQVLYFCDIYSLGGNYTRFYSIDDKANIVVQNVQIGRDGNGHINSLIFEDEQYNFQLDNLGNVLSYSTEKFFSDTITYFVSSPEFESKSPKIIFESKEIISTQKGDSIINHYSKFVYNLTYCSITDTLIIDVTLTGINQTNNTNTIKIYPNPAHTYVIINTGNYQLMSDYSISIKNMLGQNVFNKKTNEQEFRIDVNNFGGYGIYIVEIRDSSNSIITTRKIILN